MSIVGWVMMLGLFAFGLWVRGQGMSEDEARQFIQSTPDQPGVFSRFKGKVAGREFKMMASFQEIKESFRSGAWLLDPGWWPISIGLLALVLIAFGMFGYFFIVGAPLVKLICAGVLIYAAGRTAWEFWKA